jgi:single-strand DNA-binding protein
MRMNKVIMLSRLSKEPELRYTSGNNTAVCSFSIAVNRKFKKEGQPTADFFNVKTFGKTAEFVSKYVTKGSQVVVVGSLQNRSWDGQDGQKHYATDIIAEEVYFAESKKNNESNNGGQSNNQSSQEFYPIDENQDELPF